MFFIVGVNPRLRPLGAANGVCPACKNEGGQLHIVKQHQSLSVFFLPLFSFGSDYIATCGSCASVMSLEGKTGKRLEKDPSMPIPPGDLQVVKNNNLPRCRGCGRRASFGYSFCPGCGGGL